MLVIRSVVFVFMQLLACEFGFAVGKEHAMIEETEPAPAPSDDEAAVAEDDAAFDTCRVLLNSFTGRTRMTVSRTNYTHSPDWGHILRATLVGANQQDTVRLDFVCWTRDDGETSFAANLRPD